MLKHAFLKKKYGHTKHFNATAKHARFARHDTNNNEDPSSNAMLVIPNFESMSL